MRTLVAILCILAASIATAQPTATPTTAPTATPAIYPAATPNLPVVLPYSQGGYAITDLDVDVPTTYPYQVQLQYDPTVGESFTCCTGTGGGGTCLTVTQGTEDSPTVAAGEVYVNWNTGVMTFNIASGGDTYYCTFTHNGSIQLTREENEKREIIEAVVSALLVDGLSHDLIFSSAEYDVASSSVPADKAYIVSGYLSNCLPAADNAGALGNESFTWGSARIYNATIENDTVLEGGVRVNGGIDLYNSARLYVTPDPAMQNHLVDAQWVAAYIPTAIPTCTEAPTAKATPTRIPTASGAGGGVDPTGDTMTGTLLFQVTPFPEPTADPTGTPVASLWSGDTKIHADGRITTDTTTKVGLWHWDGYDNLPDFAVAVNKSANDECGSWGAYHPWQINGAQVVVDSFHITVNTLHTNVYVNRVSIQTQTPGAASLTEQWADETDLGNGSTGWLSTQNYTNIDYRPTEPWYFYVEDAALGGNDIYIGASWYTYHLEYTLE